MWHPIQCGRPRHEADHPFTLFGELVKYGDTLEFLLPDGHVHPPVMVHGGSENIMGGTTEVYVYLTLHGLSVRYGFGALAQCMVSARKATPTPG